MSPQCHYYDATQCKADANRIGGVCLVNKRAGVQSGSGNGLYCKVQSDGASECIFEDFNSCNDKALKDKSVCVRNNNKTKPPESFKFLNGVYN